MVRLPIISQFYFLPVKRTEIMEVISQWHLKNNQLKLAFDSRVYCGQWNRRKHKLSNRKIFPENEQDPVYSRLVRFCNHLLNIGHFSHNLTLLLSFPNILPLPLPLPPLVLAPATNRTKKTINQLLNFPTWVRENIIHSKWKIITKQRIHLKHYNKFVK